MAMQGRMQDWPLTVDRILDHAKSWHGDREVVSRSVEGPIVRTTFGQIHGRAKRVSNVLQALGVQPGDRVATLAWNTGRHIEAWYGIMGIGAVCHTLNPRLFSEQLVYIINHAEDRVIFTDITFLPILAEIRDQIPTVKKFIVLTDPEHMSDTLPGALCYETLLAETSDTCAWGGFDENSPAGLCYTSGTTGNPKGVLYSHRSNFLHTLVTMGADVLGIGAQDTVLPVVPMFHANAWGIAFSAPAVGAKLVMPGPKLDGASIHELLESEQVTYSAAVPTVWQMLLTHLRATNGKLTSLKRVVIGGSAVPEAIIRGFRDEFGVDVTHAWGMTETSPLGTQATPTHRIAAMDEEAQLRFKLKQGRPPLGIDLKLEDDDGNPVPRDGHTFGRLMVKGPFVVGEYFRGDGGHILDEEGFFDTGDVAILDEHGFMQITDRSKDVIKSGGEWISSIEIENIAAGHPKAEFAAVIGVAHPKWDERPLLLVKLKPGETATREEFLQFLEGKIAKWCMPDDVVFVDDIPLGATGKIDKKLIRQRMADYVLPTAAGAAAAATVALAAAQPKIYAPEPEPEPEPEPVTAQQPPPLAVPPEASLAAPPEAAPMLAALIEPPAPVEPAVAEAPQPAAAGPAAEPVAEAPAAPEIPAAPVATELAADPVAALAEPPPQPMGAPAEGEGKGGPFEHPRAGSPFADDLPAAEVAYRAQTPLSFAPIPARGGRRAARRAGTRTRALGPADVYLGFAGLVAVAPALMVGAAMIGVHAGLIDWRTGLGMIATEWAPKVALLSVATGLLGVIVALFAGFRGYWVKAIVVLALSIATLGAYTWLQEQQAASPPVNDVATDWSHPLSFSQRMILARGAEAIPVDDDPIAPLGSTAYSGRRVAEINAATCAGAQPLLIARATSEAYARAKAAIQQAGLALVTDDPRSGRLEATARSPAFDMPTDLVVRVSPAEGGARIDMRAIGRAALPDLGANCGRIRHLLGAIRS
jgi:fatty-acyl-CoA synthase